METINNTVSPTELRELAFAQLEHSIATLRRGASHLDGGSPLIKFMTSALDVAESAVKALSPTVVIKALPGALHEVKLGAAQSNGSASEATQTQTPKRRGGWPKGKPRGPRKPKAVEKKARPYAVAHTKVSHLCGGHELGCESKKISGNSAGRHEQLCPYFQTGEFLKAGIAITGVSDYVKALRDKLGDAFPYKGIGSAKRAVQRNYGDYAQLLEGVKAKLAKVEKPIETEKPKGKVKQGSKTKAVKPVVEEPAKTEPAAESATTEVKTA